MSVSVRATVTKNADVAAIAAKVSGLSDKRMAAFAEKIVARAKTNAAALTFEDSSGDLEEKIKHVRLDVRKYQIETYSGHASYIEFGTRFIEGKQPFLWPAYRTEKKSLFSGGPWV